MDNLAAEDAYPQAAARHFPPPAALASVQTATPRTRTLKLDGTKIASLFLQAQLLLISQNHFGNAHPGIELKCFLRLLVQCGGCMKRRSARQLVRLLADIRHATHCSTLRAAATNRAIALASAESEADAADSDDSPESARDAHQDKPVRSGS
ncbi:hypothetical protein [Paraburkholderia ginsengisoli]|nr:hypothetical protein [Paraburkholderia ginsengisoli]